MNPKEKEDFAELIRKAANKMAKTVRADIVDAYYDYLKDYPLALIERAINQAYRERDPDDIYLRTQMVSSIEIEQAAKAIIEEEGQAERARCSKCGGMAWIVEERKDGRIVAHPCECLYNRASKALVAKGKSGKDRMNSRYWETIVKSYEAYQRR